MEEITRRTADYAFNSGLEVHFFKNTIKVASGNYKTAPQLSSLFQDPEIRYFVVRNRRHRFLKYLSGQVFIGYFLALSFGSIGVVMTMLNIWLYYQSSQLLLIPLSIIPLSVSYGGYKMASIARKRLTKSLQRPKRRPVS